MLKDKEIKYSFIFIVILILFSFFPLQNAELEEGISPPRRAIRILSISGGGMQGIMPIIVLTHMEQLSGKKIHELFDLIGGTSIGAVIGSLLTFPSNPQSKQAKYSAQEILDIFIKEKDNIFKKRHSYLPNFFGPIYDKTSLENVAIRLYGDTPFSDALIPTVAVTTIKSSLETKLVTSWDKQETYLIRNVILASSAAPYLFPSHILTTIDGKVSREVIDGGINANNPTAHLMKEAKRLFGEDNKFEVVHLGTGDCQDTLIRRLWNLVPYNPFNITKVTDGLRNNLIDFYIKLQSYLIEEGMKMIHTGTYLPLNPVIKSYHLGVDNTCKKNISHVQQLTHEYLVRQIEQVRLIIKKLQIPKTIM